MAASTWSCCGAVKLRLAFVALAMCCCLVDCDGQQFCGKELSQVLSVVCNGCYNSRDKKYIRPAIDDSYWELASLPSKKDGDDLEELEEAERQPPFRDRLRAADMISNTYKRFTRGVADECCRKQCTFAEVKNYCCEKSRRSGALGY